MKKERFLLVILSIVLNCVITEAKLTIAYINNAHDTNTLHRMSAQLRQALVDIYGEEKVREYAIEQERGKWSLHLAYIGNGPQMILSALTNNSGEEGLLKLKEALDYLAIKGDTICLASFEPYWSPGIYDFKRTLTNQTEIRLLLGNVYEEGLKMVQADIGFYFMSPDGIYGHEREKNELNATWSSIWSQKKAGINIDKEEREYCNRVFDLLMISDKEWLAQPLPPTAKVLDNFSYEYDKDAPVKIIHEVKK